MMTLNPQNDKCLMQKCIEVQPRKCRQGVTSSSPGWHYAALLVSYNQ